MLDPLPEFLLRLELLSLSERREAVQQLRLLQAILPASTHVPSVTCGAAPAPAGAARNARARDVTRRAAPSARAEQRLPIMY